nr:uncharacterized mitochondrial protein AtMg00810-like [Tanacetum cinerariifolium]
VDHPAPEVIASIAEVVSSKLAASTGSPSSTTVDQDAPSPSNSQITPETQSPTIPNDVKEDNHDLDARPTEKHLHAVKRIFWYLRGTINQGLWYPEDSSIALTAFVDADHAGCQDTRRSKSGSMQFLRDRLLADIFTKALGRERTEFLINKLGMRSFMPETLKQLADEVEE